MLKAILRKQRKNGALVQASTRHWLCLRRMGKRQGRPTNKKKGVEGTLSDLVRSWDSDKSILIRICRKAPLLCSLSHLDKRGLNLNSRINHRISFTLPTCPSSSCTLMPCGCWGDLVNVSSTINHSLRFSIKRKDKSKS